MSKIIIVSIISDQTIPNVLFIKEKGPADFYYFVSSEIMEKRQVVKHTVNALKIENYKTIEVKEDSIIDIDNKLGSSLKIEDDDSVLVNITGGTKLMSLAVYNYFTRIGAGDIFYMPIGKNEIKQIFPFRKNRVIDLTVRVNLLEYLTAYGVEVQLKSFEKKNKLLKPIADTENLFDAFLTEKRIPLFQIAEKVRGSRRGKKIRKSKEVELDLYNQVQIFKDVGIHWDNSDFITENETKYMTGDWFEEYIYSKIKNNLNITDDEIAIGLQLTKDGSPNEYDVMFIHNNSLYVIECKTDVADNEEGKISYLFTNTLYKAATLKKEFGLWVKYYLFALNDFSQLKDSQKKRANQLDIKLVGLEILSDEEKLKKFISTM